VTHHAFSSGAGRTSDGNGSHASTLKSPSYTKSVSWQHYLCADAKKVQRQILHVPGFWAELSWHLRQRTTGKTKALYNKV
ncbi:hypothetical protein ACVOES_08450, partial [Shigella flexneri]